MFDDGSWDVRMCGLGRQAWQQEKGETRKEGKRVPRKGEREVKKREAWKQREEANMQGGGGRNKSTFW
jgi:hypothetical protein